MEWGKLRQIARSKLKEKYFIRIFAGKIIRKIGSNGPEAKGERLIHIYSGLGGTIEGIFFRNRNRRKELYHRTQWQFSHRPINGG
jgi:hypothetical protein